MTWIADWMRTPLSRFRAIGFIEGISYLLLLGVAMPIKYGLDVPEVVSVVGMAHGVLFVVYNLALLQAFLVYRWKIGRGAVLFLAAWIPFATFWTDVRILRALDHDDERAKTQHPEALKSDG